MITKDREDLLHQLGHLNYSKPNNNRHDHTEGDLRFQLDMQNHQISELTISLNQHEEELRAAEKVGDFFTDEMNKNLEMVHSLQMKIIH